MLQAVHETGESLMQESSLGADDIRQRLDQLTQSWNELKSMAENRYGRQNIKTIIK
jgi:hypothetical protein